MTREASDNSISFQKPPAEPTVMLVEDEPRLRQFMESELPRMGFEIISYQSAEEAIRMIQNDEAHFEIAILDLNLPVMNGLNCLEKLRKIKGDFPAIILTGFGDLDAARLAIDLGVSSFLTKPCRLDELENALSKAKHKLMSDWHQALGQSPKQSAAPQIEEPDIANANDGTLAELQRKAIFKAIEECEGNRSAAAKKLGISRRTLYNKIAEYESEGYEVP